MGDSGISRHSRILDRQEGHLVVELHSYMREQEKGWEELADSEYPRQWNQTESMQDRLLEDFQRAFPKSNPRSCECPAAG